MPDSLNLPTIRYMERLVRDFLPGAAAKRFGPPERRGLLVVTRDQQPHLFTTVTSLIDFIADTIHDNPREGY